MLEMLLRSLCQLLCLCHRVLHEQWIMDKYVRQAFKIQTSSSTTNDIITAQQLQPSSSVTLPRKLTGDVIITAQQLQQLSSVTLSQQLAGSIITAQQLQQSSSVTLPRKLPSATSVCNSITPFPVSDYHAEHKKGYLWKRGKKKDTFYRRLFILDGDENTLRYYNQEKNVRANPPEH
jgi:hypothetical protein